MATKPTRQQDRACDQLAQALLLIAEAARLDGRSSFDRSAMGEVAGAVARASSAFDFDTIVSRAIETRGRALSLRAGTADLLTLIEDGTDPLKALLLPDADFLALVARAEAELGEV